MTGPSAASTSSNPNYPNHLPTHHYLPLNHHDHPALHRRSLASSAARMSTDSNHSVSRHSHHHHPHPHPYAPSSPASVSVSTSLPTHRMVTRSSASHSRAISMDSQRSSSAKNTEEESSIHSVQSGGKKVGRITKLRRKATKLLFGAKDVQPTTTMATKCTTPSRRSSRGVQAMDVDDVLQLSQQRMMAATKSSDQQKSISSAGDLTSVMTAGAALTSSANRESSQSMLMDVDHEVTSSTSESHGFEMEPPIPSQTQPDFQRAQQQNAMNALLFNVEAVKQRIPPRRRTQSDDLTSRSNRSSADMDDMGVSSSSRTAVVASAAPLPPPHETEADTMETSRRRPSLKKLSVQFDTAPIPLPSEDTADELASPGTPRLKTITVHQSHIDMLKPRTRTRTVSASKGSKQQQNEAQGAVGAPSYSVSTHLLSPDLLPSLLSPGGMEPPKKPEAFTVPLSHAKTFDVTGSYPSLLKGAKLPSLKKLSFPSTRTLESKEESPSSSTSFQHIPLQRFKTIEPAQGGFQASFAWRMNKKKEEQEHMTIHAFDKQGRTMWNRLTDFARRNGEEPSLSPPPVQQGSVMGLWNGPVPPPSTPMSPSSSKNRLSTVPEGP